MFKKVTKNKVASTAPTAPPLDYNNHHNATNGNGINNNVNNKNQQDQYHTDPVGRPQLVFHCQLAHGSPTGLISGFSNVKELYQKIADCYEFPASEVCRFIDYDFKS